MTTLEGLPPEVRQVWADAFTRVGASQCGFCTPGIIMRLAALGGPGHDAVRAVPDAKVHQALLAHLCRCTGWQTVVEGARLAFGGLRDIGCRASRPGRRGPARRHRGAVRPNGWVPT